MEPIYNAFVRQVISGGVPFGDNDARDLFHAITSVGCAQMTFLDNRWAEQARRVQRQLALPTGFVSIYSQRDVPRFLSDLAGWPPSRGLHDPQTAA